MAAPAPRRAAGEDGLEPVEPAALQPRPADGSGPAVRRVRDVAEIEPPVGREVRVQSDVHQSALAVGLDARQPRQRVRRSPSGLQNAEVAVQFRYQHAPAGQERHAPGLVERAADPDEAEGMLFGAVFARFGSVGETAPCPGQAKQDGRGRPHPVRGLGLTGHGGTRARRYSAAGSFFFGFAGATGSG